MATKKLETRTLIPWKESILSMVKETIKKKKIKGEHLTQNQYNLVLMSNFTWIYFTNV